MDAKSNVSTSVDKSAVRASEPPVSPVPLFALPGLPNAHASGLPPACNTGATSDKNPGISTTNFYGWDWSSTTHDAQEDSVYRMLEALGAVHTLPGKGLQGWSRSVKAFDREGFALGSIYFGGGRKDLHVVSTSSVADTSRPLVTGIGNARTARVDTRVDTLVPFDELEKILTAAAATYGARITYMELSLIH